MTHCDPSELHHERAASPSPCTRILFRSVMLSALLAGCAHVAVAPAAPVAQTRASSATTIEIALAGVNKSDGNGPIHIALWGSERTFMKDGQWVRGVSVAAADAATITTMTDLAPGRYALSAFHDTTNCGSLRRNLLGIPIDPWAFSNGGSSLIPPSWRRASFEVAAGTTRIEMDFTHTRAVPSSVPTSLQPSPTQSAQESPHR